MKRSDIRRLAAVGGLAAFAALLRFATRGYAYWAYLCLFIAALLPVAAPIAVIAVIIVFIRKRRK